MTTLRRFVCSFRFASSRPLPLVILLGGLLASLLVTRAAPVPETVPADTKLIARLDWQAVMQSPLIQQYIEQQPERYEAVASRAFTTVGLDLEAIETLWFLGESRDDGVMILLGDFELEPIRTRLEEHEGVSELEEPGTQFAYSYRETPEGDPKLAALVDKTTLLVGGPVQVRRFLAARTGAVETLPADHPKLQRFTAGTAHLQATIIELLDKWVQANPNIAKLIKDVYLTANVDEQIHLQLLLGTADAEQSEALDMVLRGMLNLQLSQEEQKPQPNRLLMSLLEAVKTRRDGKELTVFLTVDPAQLSGRPNAPADEPPPPATEAAPAEDE